MTLRNKHSASHQAGFSLVEILVGLVIGLLATLVIMQVFSVFEGKKRTTTGTADAQINGSIALHTLTQQLKSAGFTLLPIVNSPSAITCTAPIISAAATAAGMGNVSPLSPVIITDGGTLSDSITIGSGTSPTAGVPVQMGITNNLPNISVKNNLGCQVGIAVTLPSCNVITVTAIPAPPVLPNDPQFITLGNTAGVNIIAGENLVCLGQWNEITFSVNAGNMVRQTAQERNAGIAPTPVISDIVSIQAQYGISAAGLVNTAANFNSVIQWVDATGAWAAPTTINRNRIKAVRIAVIARNGLLEKTNVSRACGSASSATNSGTEVCAWPDQIANPNVTGSLASTAPTFNLNNLTNWQQYRYRVFTTIIPIRNVMWSKEAL
jgi:type IV pilus assembly protein PilW